MITNALLEAKYNVQKRLSEEACHDITQYAKNSHQMMAKIEKEYKINFKYTSMRGSFDDIQGKNIHPSIAAAP